MDFTLINIALIILWSRLNQPTSSTSLNNSICPSTCIDAINNQISQIPTSSPSKISPGVTTAIIPLPPASKSSKTVSYVTVPGSGSTDKNVWTDIPGTEFYLDTKDYEGLSETRFEANFRLLNGNGFAFIRLFDTTVGIEVWGSEVKANTQNFTVITSDKLTLRSGNHLYRIQAKSLTADTTVYNSGRLKLITSNKSDN